MKKRIILSVVFAVLGLGLILGACDTGVVSPDITPADVVFPREEAPAAPNYQAWNELLLTYCAPLPEEYNIDPLPQVLWPQFDDFCKRPAAATPKPTINIWVKKDWGDLTPQAVSINLYRNGEKWAEKSISDSEGTDISSAALVYDADGKATLTGDPVPGRRLYQFTDLPVYDDNGVKYLYQVEEADLPEGIVPSYPELKDQASIGADGRITITEDTERVEFYSNTFYFVVRIRNIEIPQEELVTLTVQKIWEDDGNSAEFRPDSLALALKAKIGNDTVDVSGYTISGPEKDGDTWTYTFSNLPKYADQANKTGEIEYAVEETIPPKYNRQGYTKDGDTISFINSYKPPDYPGNPTEEDIKAIWVKKDWGIKNNRTAATIQLWQWIEGEAAPAPYQKSSKPLLENVPQLLYYNGNTPVFSSEDTPGRDLYQFEKLPLTQNGKKITYYISEDPVPAGYHVEYPWEADSSQLGLRPDGEYDPNIGDLVRVSFERTEIEFMNQYFYVVLIRNVKD